MLTAVNGIQAEKRGSGPVSGRVIIGDAAERMEELTGEYAGKIPLIYLDPPFSTGKKFEMRLKLGQADWKSSTSSLTIPSYSDDMPREELLALMRRVLEASKQLLAADGLMFIHVDYRLHAYMRLLADEILGEKNFINEIIWAYESGGRSKRFFSRKHDVILMYAATADYDLHLEDVAEVPTRQRTNHMRRMVDGDGRSYRTIMSAGKLYRYFDDDPVPPSDVWTDVSHLQQRDPQRLGFETQKPLKLLERIVKCASRKGDTVLDPFCGSGTTLEAACRHGRNFIGIDSNPIVPELVRKRTDGCSCVFEYPENDGSPLCDCEFVPGLAYNRVFLNSFLPEEGLIPVSAEKLDFADSWAVGTVEDGIFTVLSEEKRTFRTPALKGELEVPLEVSEPVIRVSDVLGRRFFYALGQ